MKAIYKIYISDDDDSAIIKQIWTADIEQWQDWLPPGSPHLTLGRR